MRRPLSYVASVHSHLIHGEALFNRAICQSGVANSLGPLPLDSAFHQGLFDALKNVSNSQSLEELRALSSTELINLTPKLFPDLPAFFMVDDSQLTSGFFPIAEKRNSSPKFCEAVLIGYCGNEVCISKTSRLLIF
jgi:hypothetical protein